MSRKKTWQFENLNIAFAIALLFPFFSLLKKAKGLDAFLPINDTWLGTLAKSN